MAESKYLDLAGLQRYTPKLRKQIGSSMTELTNENLNDIKAVGWYYTQGSDSVINKPAATCLNNIIHVVTQGTITVQVLESAGSFYTRLYSGGEWSAWKRVLNEDDIGVVTETQYNAIATLLA